MRRYTAQWVYPSFWIFGVAALQACAPLTNGANSSTQSCLVSILSNNGAVGIGQLNVPPPVGVFSGFNTAQLAQSFQAISTTTISAVSLNLDIVQPNVTQQLNSSSIVVSVEPDSLTSTTGNATPSTPAGPTSSLGSGTIQTSNILTTTTGGPSFISVPLSANLTQGQIYWVVATPSYTPSATNYVEWRYASTALLNQLADYFNTLSNIWSTASTSINYDFQVGC